MSAIDKYGEITKITLAQNSIYITGKAWGIPKLEANLKNLYKNGTFTIKTGNGFEFNNIHISSKIEKRYEKIIFLNQINYY